MDNERNTMSTETKHAPKPPMGWNSWISYACYVQEDEIRAHADYMAKHLLPFGYDTVVVDALWASTLPPETNISVDPQGRLIPCPKRFPSSAGGKGFKPLADYCHALGLKFGLHQFRGVPVEAILRKCNVMGTRIACVDIVDPDLPTGWDTGNRSVDMRKPGSQAYYDSVLNLFAEWGVDFVKFDDMIKTQRYGHCLIPTPQAPEVEGIARAIKACGRPMVFSISPGEADPSQADFMRQHVDMQRISGDFWDSWDELRLQFDLCAAWAPHIGAGFWPDADMLPLGKIALRFDSTSGRGPDRDTRFNYYEQITLMTLWCICRSPLMLGNDLVRTDPLTLALITNPEVLAVNQASTDNRERFRRNEHIVWTAREPQTGDTYLAVFNLSATPSEFKVELKELGWEGPSRVRDLWARRDLAPCVDSLTAKVPAHGAMLYRIAASGGK
jgi:hypothetical protein